MSTEGSTSKTFKFMYNCVVQVAMAAASTPWQDNSMPGFRALEAQISDSIWEFFTKAQFAALTELEKRRYRNIRKNYEMMALVGKMLIWWWFIFITMAVNFFGGGFGLYVSPVHINN